MAHDVFISYAEEDKSVADAVCQALEERAVRCWYAPRDVPYAVDYEDAIIDAISESRLMILVLSSHANNSPHVKREVQNAHTGEQQVPVLPFQIENISLNKSLRYYIGSVQWLSALTPPMEKHLQKLTEYVHARLSLYKPEIATGTQDSRNAQAIIDEQVKETSLREEEELRRRALVEEEEREIQEARRQRHEQDRLTSEAIEAARRAEEERQQREAEEKREREAADAKRLPEEEDNAAKERLRNPLGTPTDSLKHREAQEQKTTTPAAVLPSSTGAYTPLPPRFAHFAKIIENNIRNVIELIVRSQNTWVPIVLLIVFGASVFMFFWLERNDGMNANKSTNRSQPSTVPQSSAQPTDTAKESTSPSNEVNANISNVTNANSSDADDSKDANTATEPSNEERKSISPLRASQTPSGSQITVTSDGALSDFSAYRSGDRFYVLIPAAAPPRLPSNLRGRGFDDVRVQKRNNDVLLSFRLLAGATAHVNQKFNRLEVIITVPALLTPK